MRAPSPPVSGEAASILAFLAAYGINAVTVARSFVLPPRVATRALHYGYEAGHFLALGLASAALVKAYARWGKNLRSRGFFGLLAIAVALGAATLPADLSNAAARFGGGRGAFVVGAMIAAGVVLVSLGLPIAWMLGRLLSRPWLRWLGIAGGWAILSVNPIVLLGDYHGIHLFVGLAGALLLAASLAGASPPRLLGSMFARAGRVSAVAYALAGAGALFSMVFRPAPTVEIELVRSDGSLLAHFLGRVRSDVEPLRKAEIPAEMLPWFADAPRPEVAPTETPVVAPRPVILLMTIDTVRADVIMTDRHRQALPWLSSIRRRSVRFPNARAASSSTSTSLTALFSSTYYSQQYWTPLESKLSPHEDPGPQFPGLLHEAGVTTANFASMEGLLAKYGVTRGFSEESLVGSGKSIYASAESIVTDAMERLSKVEDEPFFLYLHFLEPHAPYNQSSVQGGEFERYVGEIALVDLQIGRLMRHLATLPIRHRVTVILTADHGEAFGEHGVYRHASTVYEELLRVPLLVMLPDGRNRDIAEPVSLVDLGPTILDLFRVPTPGSMMGQSLVPFLVGQDPKLHRPIAAEARLKQTLVLPDGRKIIVDGRNHTVELYDLRRDPGERNNLADDPDLLAEPLSLLRQFFDANTIRRPGYTVPYRP